MTPDWFNEWVGVYCDLTGSGDKVRTVLLANRHTVTAEWRATAAEMGHAAVRLVAGGRVPAFPTEVTNALRAELHALREEAARLPRPDPASQFRLGTAPAGPRCRLCGDSGWVTVPVRACVEVPADGPPRIVYFPGTRQVPTRAVLCDRPGCDPGAAARAAEDRSDRKAKRPTLGAYQREFGTVNVPALYEAYEAAVAAACRELPEFDGRAGTGAALGRIKGRAAGRVPPGADPEEFAA
jgi:hypothetical protein